MTDFKNFTTTEFMAVIVSREIKNDDIAFIGVGIPLMAGILAVTMHAPECTLIYEGGGIGARTRRLPWTISDNPTTDNALSAAQMWRVFSDQQAGYVTLGIIGGAEIDVYGNLNTTVILGDSHRYHWPRVRLPGSGGANDIASSAERTVIMMRIQKGKFVKKLGYLTSPGHLTGPGARQRAGLRGKGPVKVITEKAVFAFDPETKEMYLQSLLPGFTVQDIRDLVEWDLKVAPTLVELEPPTEEQVRILRSFDPMGFVLGSKGAVGGEDFNHFYERVKKGYESISLNLDD